MSPDVVLVPNNVVRALDRGAEGSRRGLIEEHSGAAVDQRLPRRPSIESNNRKTVRVRLDGSNPEVLIGAENHRTRGFEQIASLLFIDLADEGHAWARD